MIERDEALTSAKSALAILADRMPKSPRYGVYLHAEEQLNRIVEQLGFRYLPPVQQRAWVDIGIMAVKELETADPDLANALMDADYNFKHSR